jgi:hypothetical protein
VTILLDLRVLDYDGKTLTPPWDKQYLNRFAALLQRMPEATRVVVVAPYNRYTLEEVRAALPESWNHKVCDVTPYAWIRVPYISEQEVAMYVIQHPAMAPFYFIGTGFPSRTWYEVLYVVDADLLDLATEQELDALL